MTFIFLVLIPLDAFEDERDPSALIDRLKTLCINPREVEEVIQDLGNLHLYQVSDKECYEKLIDVLPDCSPETISKVLASSASFLCNRLADQLVNRFKSSLDNERLKLINPKISIFKQEDVLTLDIATCLSLLKSGDQTDIVMNRIQDLVNSQNCPLESLDKLLLTIRKSVTGLNQVHQLLADNENPRLFDFFMLSTVFVEAKFSTLWKDCLDKCTEVGRHGVQVGKLLNQLHYSYLLSFRMFLLKMMEECEFSEKLCDFVAAVLHQLQNMNKTDFFSDLMLLASESEDMKFVDYLNALIDTDSAPLSLTDFRAVIDVIEYVPSSMVLAFYGILVRIALKMSQRSNDQAINELCLIIRKQLASPVENVCLNGVAGAIAMMMSTTNPANQAFDFDEPSCSQAQGPKSRTFRAPPALLKELLQLSYSSSMRFVSTAKFFYAHIAEAADSDSLPSDLFELLNEQLAGDFQKIFVAEFDSDVPADGEIKYNLLEEEELIVLKLYPQIVSQDAVRVLCMAEHLKVLALLEKKLNGGSLENIDAIIKFPLVFPDPSKHDAQLVFSTHLTALNFMKQSINSFFDQADISIQLNCRKRLIHLTEIMTVLKETMKKSSSFSCFRSVAGQSQICPEQLRGNKEELLIHTEMAHQILAKVHAYSSDKIASSNQTRQTVRIKTDVDLYDLSVPIDREVFTWFAHGIDVDSKSKSDCSLAEDEFYSLVNEMRQQLEKNIPVLDAFDMANSSFLEYLPRADDDCDLKMLYPKILLEIAGNLRSINQLTPSRLDMIRRIYDSVSEDEGLDVTKIKLKLLLCVNKSDEAAIIGDLAHYCSEHDDAGTISNLLPQLKPFKSSLQSIYSALYCKQDKNLATIKLLLELLIIEIPKACSLEDDLWVLQQLENLAQASKATYGSDTIDVLLRYSKEAVDLVVAHVMPRLEHFLLEHKENVLGILKKFQQFTRTVQTICNHIKATKDNSLLKRVPPLKKSLEVSLLRVKQMLQVNHCPSAFWVGNLKHKGLDGKEVPAQIPMKRDELDQDEDEDIPDTTEESSEHEMETEDPTLALSL